MRRAGCRCGKALCGAGGRGSWRSGADGCAPLRGLGARERARPRRAAPGRAEGCSPSASPSNEQRCWAGLRGGRKMWSGLGTALPVLEGVTPLSASCPFPPLPRRALGAALPRFQVSVSARGFLPQGSCGIFLLVLFRSGNPSVVVWQNLSLDCIIAPIFSL